MGYTVSYRTCQPLSPEREAAVRGAADAFNAGRAWVLHLVRNEQDGHLVCFMEPAEKPDGEPAAGSSKWPGAYEGKCLLDGLCDISRACQVDWEIRDTYCLRPVGVIRNGECHADPEAQAEALRHMGEVMRRRSLN
jgi:hypothetical protein